MRSPCAATEYRPIHRGIPTGPPDGSDGAELYDHADENGEGTGQYRVHDRDAYLQAVLTELRAVGLCPQLDFVEETVQVKDTNDLSEDFELLAE